MLLVHTSLNTSPIHGLGCFTNEFIKQGQVVWIYDPRVDVRIPISELSSLPAPIQEHMKIYGYAEVVNGQKVITLCGDHAKHMNHSQDPNIIEAGGQGELDIAGRDIEAGEELTCNYLTFDLDAVLKLGYDLKSVA